MRLSSGEGPDFAVAQQSPALGPRTARPPPHFAARPGQTPLEQLAPCHEQIGGLQPTRLAGGHIDCTQTDSEPPQCVHSGVTHELAHLSVSRNGLATPYDSRTRW